jgi:hypothetical protein
MEKEKNSKGRIHQRKENTKVKDRSSKTIETCKAIIAF